MPKASEGIEWRRGRRNGVAALARVFSYDVAQTIGLFQCYLDNRGQFGSVMDLCANRARCVSIAVPQLDAGPFVDLVKRIETFPAPECVCERLFCQLRIPVGTSGTKCMTR
jgi:hypothetical protein